MKAIVTGHSRGLGAALAENLLSRGIAVLGLARGRNPGLAERHPGRLAEAEIDLSDWKALAAWLAGEALAAFLAGCGRALLINNAGTVQPVSRLGQQDPAAIARAVNLNLTAPLLLANAFAAASSAAVERRIMHISSGAARSPYAGWDIYCATKAALDHHARSAGLEDLPGLRIASVAPGVIDTDMQAEIREVSPERFPLKERFVALKRDGSLTGPDESAERLVRYLLSEGFGQMPVADVRELRD